MRLIPSSIIEQVIGDEDIGELSFLEKRYECGERQKEKVVPTKAFTELEWLLNISRNPVANMYYYHGKELKIKRGPKLKISQFKKLQIKREIANLKKREEKINSSKK